MHGRQFNSYHEQCRLDACVIEASDHLYAFGGNIPQSSDYVAIAERFDTLKNKWERIADMLEGRSCVMKIFKSLMGALGKIIVTQPKST